jgi:hypothetical protein
LDISSATNRLTPCCYINCKSKSIDNVTQQALKLFDLEYVRTGNSLIMAKKNERFRKAGDGQYTTEEYAKKHPKTTVKETTKQPKKIVKKK